MKMNRRIDWGIFSAKREADDAVLDAAVDELEQAMLNEPFEEPVQPTVVEKLVDLNDSMIASFEDKIRGLNAEIETKHSEIAEKREHLRQLNLAIAALSACSKVIVDDTAKKEPIEQQPMEPRKRARMPAATDLYPNHPKAEAVA